MRKHMYLITEHNEEDYIGRVKFQDRKNAWPDKNKEGDIQKYNGEDFYVVGKQVCLGFHDFESEESYSDPERAREVIQGKLGEVDGKWLDKAGVELDGEEV